MQGEPSAPTEVYDRRFQPPFSIALLIFKNGEWARTETALLDATRELERQAAGRSG